MKDLVLVTGGSGYFGSLLVKSLLSGGYRCRVFDINDAYDRRQDVEFIQGDIRDFDSIKKACKGVEIIHHNVAQVPLAKDRHLFESVNIKGAENLLKAALQAEVRKVVFTSSSAVFGRPKTNPVTEDTPPAPAEAYGKAKLEGEKLAREYSSKGLDVAVIRPRTILGHGRLGIFQILFEWVREGANIPVLGKGDNLYQFVHAEDLAEACILASTRTGSAVYNIGAERFGTMRQGLEALCNYAATGSRVKSLPSAPAEYAMRITGKLGLSPLGPYHALMYGHSLFFDISRAKNELKWAPKFSNEEMLIESYEWYLKNRDEVLATHGRSHHRSALEQGILKLVKSLL